MNARTPARADGVHRRIFHGHPATGVAMLLCALLALTACDDGDDPLAPGGTTQPRATATQFSLTPPPSPPPELATSIGVRGNAPENDPVGLAARYKRTQGRAPLSKPFAGELDVGHTRNFNTLLIGDAAPGAPPPVATVNATLRARTEHAYVYVDSALAVDDAAVLRSADFFETRTWPAVTRVFAQPPTPGVDGDPRIVVLYSNLGGVGGYHLADDRFLASVRPRSNEAEMIYLDTTVAIGSAAFDIVLAHEFEHLLHGGVDGGEEAWVDEGLAEIAAGLVGGSAAASPGAFAANPATQLNTWTAGSSQPHYGASAAFMRYLAARFGGEEAHGTIAGRQGDGEAGIDEFLTIAGTPQRFRAVFADWIVANILNEPDGPYANPVPVDARVPHTLDAGASATGEAAQFGADYYQLGVDAGEYEVRFSGTAETPALPVAPEAGDPFLWSNTEDGIDSTITREIDLTSSPAPVLTYRAWFDIEPWFDWAYVAVSEDNGDTWTALTPEHVTRNDPVAQAYGPGYTGSSDGWVDERIDLAQYAGKKLQLRFEYVTDGSTYGDGLAIDDVAIDGVAVPDEGWYYRGWLLVDRPLPQTYAVRVIGARTDGGEPLVVDVPVDAAGRGTVRFSADGLDYAVLAIAGTTEGTRQRAPYTVELVRP